MSPADYLQAYCEDKMGVKGNPISNLGLPMIWDLIGINLRLWYIFQLFNHSKIAQFRETAIENEI